ncbi:MAG TPA: glycoside hydrolase family 99-like domain-containing protein [Thermoanaerobaculia bacterium]|nr:glycoside hydrolase family 99-like domain-containing protein [Thermoanaerobaculia bacterium]
MFERLSWLPDRALLGDFVFRLEPSRSDGWDLGDDCFGFYKNRQLVEQFDRFWSATDFRPRHMLEIGIWDGGSTAFWYEHLRPERLVAIDQLDREDSPYFRRYLATNGLEGRVLTRWRTDQADRAALREIVERDLGGELDLVIDDGSHLDVPTRASFEALFPLLPPGGLYVIEDWAWEHWPDFQDPGHVWAGEESLAALVCDLVAAAGSSRTLFRSLAVYEGFVVAERGDWGHGGDGGEDLHGFRLADHIRRRPWRAAAAVRARPEEDVKILAFYLPQFHPIPENDRWWGKGFTEWSRVTRARPQFAGHYQPHLPERLGFYDLRLPETRARQAALARGHGIHGFCYYYYWFGAKTLLERPLAEMLAGGGPDLPFCVCWANENWTRRWDGAERELLIEQRYGPELDAPFIADLTPFFRDRRYLRVRGAPVLLVYRPGAIPEPQATTARWRRAAREQGLPDLHLVAALTFGLQDPRPLGFDAAVEFPPHGENLPANSIAVDGIEPGFGGEIVDYRAVASRRLALPPPPFRLYRTAMAGWDNTPRLGRRATIFHGASPATYEEWLRGLVTAARLGHPEHRLVFVNAWNEWAEGAHLEPDDRFGTGYLEATRRALAG